MAQPALTSEELILLTIEDDVEEAPWMVMGDQQFWAASDLAQALRVHIRRRRLGWYVSSMLPIRFSRPHTTVKGVLAPDLLVATVDDRPRQSFDVEEEGGFPPFVLEVLSPESTVRDRELKLQAYDALGAQEYALFAPAPGVRPPALQGFRREPASGTFVRWQPDRLDRLYSTVLDLWLLPQGRELRLQDRAGVILPTYEELEDRNEALEGRNDHLEGRNERLEDEIARLRDELTRYPKL